MKKYFVLIILLVVSGCSNPTTTIEDYPSSSISGYVTALQEGKFLVVSESPKSKDAHNNEIFDAIWFSSEESEDVEIGDYLHVWSGASFLSYPGQATATKFVIEEQERQRTNLTKKEVIQKAIIELDKLTEEHYFSPILTKIQYEKQKDSWNISFENINLNKPHLTIHIKDSK